MPPGAPREQSLDAREASRCLNHSRILLLIRLRATAFPTLRLTVTPSRFDICGFFASFGGTAEASKTKFLEAARTPHPETRRKSRDFKSRSDRRKRPVGNFMPTSCLLKRRAASDPSPGGDSIRSAHYSSSFSLGSRVCVFVGCDSAGKYASSSFSSHSTTDHPTHTHIPSTVILDQSRAGYSRSENSLIFLIACDHSARTRRTPIESILATKPRFEIPLHRLWKPARISRSRAPCQRIDPVHQ